MSAHEPMHAQLLSLMEEALVVCARLQNFSAEMLTAFSSSDDQSIIRAIGEREDYLNKLVNLEYKVDQILDEVDEYDYGNALPPDVDEVRRSVRKVLGSVTEMDLKALEFVSGKMQTYKDETLKARNKKHLSAYIRSGMGGSSGGSYDYKN